MLDCSIERTLLQRRNIGWALWDSSHPSIPLRVRTAAGQANLVASVTKLLRFVVYLQLWGLVGDPVS